MRSRPTPSANRHRAGIATVEMALIVPLLAVLAIGSIDVTRAIQVKHYLTDAARTGARAATKPGCNDTSVKSAITTTLANYGIASNIVTPTIKVNGVVANCSTAKSGDSVQIRVSVPITSVAWIPTMFFSTSTVDSESLTMVHH
jgi:Flp pilus assembly protein TadG